MSASPDHSGFLAHEGTLSAWGWDPGQHPHFAVVLIYNSVYLQKCGPSTGGYAASVNKVQLPTGRNRLPLRSFSRQLRGPCHPHPLISSFHSWIELLHYYPPVSGIGMVPTGQIGCPRSRTRRDTIM